LARIKHGRRETRACFTQRKIEVVATVKRLKEDDEKG